MWLIDRLSNLVSGLGTAKDKGAHNVFGLSVLTTAELNAMHRGDWLARKIIDIIPHDMTREWRDWQAEDDQIEKLEEAERALGVQQKITESMQRARLLGGAGLYVGTEDGDVSQELKPDSIGAGGIRYLHVLSREEITAGEMIRDVLSPFFGRPAYYQMTSAAGAVVRIHPSRIIPFIGAPIFDRHSAATDAWGDSILQVVYDAVQNAASSQQHIASMLPEAKVDVIKVPGLSDHLSTAEGTARLTQRFTLMNQLKSTINAVLLEGDGDTGEVWEQKTIRFAEFPELMRLFLQIAAGAADIPVTRLLGQSPSGMNATGESDIRNYYDNIASRQQVELRPTLAPLDEMLIRHALGDRPEEVHYAWAPLWQMDDAQRAEIASKKAATTKVYVDSGLIPLDALAKATVNQLVEDGTYPGLEAAIEESPQDPGEHALEEEEAAAEQMRGGGPNAGLPFEDAKRRRGDPAAPPRKGFDPNQPRGGDGRWVPTGKRLEEAAAKAGQSEVLHVKFATVRRPAELTAMVGINVRGFKHAASNQAIRHSFSRHGTGGTELARGQKPVTPRDIARLPEIVAAGRYQPAAQRPFGPPRVKIVARLDGDEFHYVAEVRRGQRRVDMVTMWKR